MKRLFLLMVFLAVSVNANAAKMSSYTENTTPNEDVYFIGVDPNDTTQTVNGSNYRYPLSSILGSGLLDFNVNSLTVSGTGDSWIELENNTSFSDSLTGKYGIRFYNGVLQQIIDGTASALGSGVVDDTAYGVSWDDVTDEAPSKNAVYDKISTISSAGAPIIQSDDPTIADDTGWYLATTSGDAFYVVHGVGVFTMAGSYDGDTDDPVLVAGADSTHDGETAVNGTVELTEDNPANPAVTFTATGCTPTSGSCTGTYPDYVTPDLTPTGTGDVVVTFAATDLAGNAATGTDLVQEFAYSAGGTACSGIVGEQIAYTTSSSGANAYQHITRFDLGCNGSPTSINATVGAGEFKLSVYDSGFNLLYATATQFNETNSSAHTITDTGVSTLDFTGQEYIYLGITASLGSTSYRADEYGSVIGYSFTDGTSGTVAPTPIEDWPVETDTEYSRRRTVWLDFD